MEFLREAPRERFVPDAAALVALSRGFIEVCVDIAEIPPEDNHTERTLEGVREPMIDPLGPKRLSPEAQKEMDELDRLCALENKLELRARAARMLGRGPGRLTHTLRRLS